MAPISWREHDFDFTSAVFDGGDFSGSSFGGNKVSFRYARFVMGDVLFHDAVFTHGVEVSFEHAEFRGANVSFDNADFANGRVSFQSAVFISGTVDLSKVARWRPPTELDVGSGGSVLRLPTFTDSVKAILNRSFVTLVTEMAGVTKARKISSIRKKYAILEGEELIGFAAPVAFTDSGIYVDPGLVIPYKDISATGFSRRTETKGICDDLGPATVTYTYVTIHYRDMERRLGRHDDLLVAVIQDIKRIPWQ